MPYLLIVSTHLAYIYFNKIDTDGNEKFAVDLKDAVSNQAIDFLSLFRNKQYCITHIGVNPVLEQYVVKFKNCNNVIKKI